MFGWLRGRAPAAGGSADSVVDETPSAPAEITPEALRAALCGPDAPFLIDVRTPGEHAAGHIREACLLPLAQLLARLDELPQDRLIVCVCRSGHRSGMALAHLRARGYRVQHLSGGMLRWRGPVVKGEAGGS